MLLISLKDKNQIINKSECQKDLVPSNFKVSSNKKLLQTTRRH